MDTAAKDGSEHTTTSVRVCFPDHTIVYKQTQLPALMSLHTGRWTLSSEDTDVVATSRHTVAVAQGNIARVLGPDAGLEEAREYIRKALSANSMATLGHAKEYAERRS
jgi:aromatase